MQGRDTLTLTAGALRWLIADPLTVAQLAAGGVSMATADIGVLPKPDDDKPCLWLSAHCKGVKGRCALLISNNGDHLTIDVRSVSAPKFGLKLPAGWVEHVIAQLLPSALQYSEGVFWLPLPGLVTAGIQGGALFIEVEETT